MAGGGAVLLFVLLLLVPVRRAPRQTEEGEPVPVAADTSLFAPVSQIPLAHVGVGTDLDLALERRSRHQDMDGNWVSDTRDPEGGFDLDVPPVRASAPAPSPPVAQLAIPRARTDEAEDVPLKVDLSGAAQLCTDLARVRDTSELQGLLARAAGLLDASGIVVWMGGSGGTVLWPAFSHGYTPQTLSKMQALPREGRTPVSMAFRTGLMEIVPADDGSPSGAIVAPILTSTGCVGVMAVEIRHGAESSDAEQALAGIIAAQLATLVAGEQG